MPQIIPIKDLKNTGEISQMCRDSAEPIYVTKNGYGDMVIMSVRLYEKKLAMLDLYDRLEESEEQIARGQVIDPEAALSELRAKHNV
jgi:PHD/YefM family antitoxin component YafN of YafNO toxin-antitoxin module